MPYSYKTNCPHCEGNNLYVTPHNGMSYCFNCGYTAFADGRPREEMKKRGPVKIIREYYKQMTDYYHSCMTVQARKYLNSRGLTDDMIDQFKLGYCPPEINFLYNGTEATESGLINELHKPTLAGRVVFPYLYRGQVTDLRGRAIDDDPIRYKSPHGQRYFRGADYPYNTDDMYVSHILVEGEIKALTLKKHGLNAVGLPGITMHFEGYAPYKYYICLDSEVNEETRKDVKQAIYRAALWGIEPFIITIPRFDKKMGADDYINDFGIESFLTLYRAALPYDIWKRMVN